MPTIVITGPVGIGKTTTAWEVCELLEEAQIAHAHIDTDNIAWCYVPGNDDRYCTSVFMQNFTDIWKNFQNFGASHLVVSGVVESPADLERWREAVPGADFLVFRLRAKRENLLSRVRERDRDSTIIKRSEPRAIELAEQLERTDFSHFVIDTDGLSRAQVARKIFDLSRWVKE